MKKLFLFVVCLCVISSCQNVVEPVPPEFTPKSPSLYSEAAIKVFRDCSDIENDRWVFSLTLEEARKRGITAREYTDFEKYLCGLNRYLDEQEQQGSEIRISRTDCSDPVEPEDFGQTRIDYNQPIVIWYQYDMPNYFHDRFLYTGSSKVSFYAYSHQPVYAITFTANHNKITISQNSHHTMTIGSESLTQTRWDFSVDAYMDEEGGSVPPPWGYKNYASISMHVSDPFSVNRSGIEVPSGFTMRSFPSTSGSNSVYSIEINNRNPQPLYFSIATMSMPNTFMRKINFGESIILGNYQSDHYHIRVHTTDEYYFADYRWDTYAPPLQ